MKDSKSESAETPVPEDLCEALSSVPAAALAWKGLTSIGRRDFISWINEAKQAETRGRRIVRCCENLVAGKRRPCCFAVVPMDFYKALGTDSVAKSQWSKLTADEKRDMTDWIDAAENKTLRKDRIAIACQSLATGKRQ